MDDESVYRFNHKLGRIILSTHVDDGIGGASTQAVLNWLYEGILARGFKFSHRGKWETVLGFHVQRDLEKRTVTVSAGKQIRDLTRVYLASEVAASLNPATPTAESIMHLQPAGIETPEEAAAHIGWRAEARSLKGALVHLQQVHPAICNGVSRCCQHMATPTRESFAAAKRVLAWLNCRPDIGITYGAPHLRTLADLLPPDEDIMPMSGTVDYSLVCCVDSDLPGKALEPASTIVDAGSHRAQLGYNINLAGGAFDTSSRRQHSTAVDTAAAECFAASSLGAILVHIVGAVRFLSFGVLGNEPVRMWCDNDAAVLAGSDATSIKRLAYIARRVRFLQELVVRGIVRMLNLPGTANPADMFTKHLAKALFREYCARVYNKAAALFKVAS
jgi:hypothetical protein